MTDARRLAEDPLGSPRLKPEGLRSDEVLQRMSAGQSNRTAATPSQSWLRILQRNTFTRLNFLLLVLGVATISTGSLPDATFLAVAIINTVVGAAEEARAKRKLDRLALISTPRARAVRDGVSVEVDTEDLVVDDLLDLHPGDQLTVDAVVVEGAGEVDESLTTGESEPVTRRVGDALLSGTWLVAGSVRARVTHVGGDSYANRLAAEARRFNLTGSELMGAVNRVLRWVTWTMCAVGPILFWRQIQTQPWRIAVRLSVAGLVGMIPEGLILLTTLAFLASALRLARLRVVVQELPAIETLARVDALCVDKTGTLTEGRATFEKLVYRGRPADEVYAALAAMARTSDNNATLAAIAAGVSSTGPAWVVDDEIPFSSARKWSALHADGHGTWVLGAPEVIDSADPDRLGDLAASWSEAGSRVLALATGDRPLSENSLPRDLRLVALVALRERCRDGVDASLRFFRDEGVTVRVISGDSSTTAQAISRAVGVPDAQLAVDARTLPPEPEAFADAVETYRIFGRTTPDLKRDMVLALEARGHCVAMTGDGVNDVLALKAANLGVAMGSGTPIARAVAQLVLLDNDFDVLPAVVAEGRRTLANIERVAALFFTKNVYSLVLSVLVSVSGAAYPFLPRQLTLVGTLGIGIPGFFLALGPNRRRFEPGFLRRSLTLSCVAGAVTASAVLAAHALARVEGAQPGPSRVAAVVSAVVVTLWLIAVVSRPVTVLRLALIMAMAGLFVAAYFWTPVSTYFDLARHPTSGVAVGALSLGVVGALILETVTRLPALRRRILPSSIATER